jgi:Fe-S cluster assembly iron-binding protein IscA
LALDESTDELEKLESNGVTAFIDKRLHGEMQKLGDISIDFVTNEIGQSGYRITVGQPGSGCEGCSCPSDEEN